jgi:hypothetical protein
VNNNYGIYYICNLEQTNCVLVNKANSKRKRIFGISILSTLKVCKTATKKWNLMLEFRPSIINQKKLILFILQKIQEWSSSFTVFRASMCVHCLHCCVEVLVPCLKEYGIWSKEWDKCSSTCSDTSWYGGGRDRWKVLWEYCWRWLALWKQRYMPMFRTSRPTNKSIPQT